MTQIRPRKTVVDEQTWAPPLASKPELPRPDDKKKYSESMNIPEPAMACSDFIKQGRWSQVDAVLRKVYEEASQMLGRTVQLSIAVKLVIPDEAW